MTYLLGGLIIFLAVHSLRFIAGSCRTRLLELYGVTTFKVVYAGLSLFGFGLIVWGFGIAREAPVVLWPPLTAMRHATALLMWVALVLLAATYVPSNWFKSRLHHPMLLSVKTWALAHLLATATLATLLLFSLFLIWSVVLFVLLRRADRVNQVQFPDATIWGTVVTVLAGSALWCLFVFYLHGLLIGIRPLG